MEHTHYAGPQPTQYAPTFNTYNDFTLYLKDRKCSKCNVGFIQSSKDVDALFQSWLSGTAKINSHVKCKKCSRTTCIACSGKSMPTEKDVEGTDKKISWCCSRGRLFTIWILICGFDQEFCHRKGKETSTSSQSRHVASGTGVGYGSWSDKYQDPFGHFPKQTMPDDGKKTKAENTERRGDYFDRMILSFLAVICPSPHHDVDNSSFDVRPPMAVVSMLVNSKILDNAAELLRNDSLDNATQRTNLYMALIRFLKRVGVHEASKQEVIFNDRVLLPANVNLLTLSFRGAPPKAGETASSLADGLRRFNIQSDMMMRGAQKARKEFQDQRGQDMLWLCREISDLSTHLKIEEWWTQHCGGYNTQDTDHGIVEVPDDQIWPTYRFVREAQGLRQSPAGRIRRLITEITSLKTGLSSGIYVKHAMSRLDVMRILIVAPEGTPYENGLFEFDLWCPQDYPRVPPVVNFKYPAGCHQSINPNLHLDGKVCLSLLGTWESGSKGEEWQPGLSTILQVLISIQAMIFCEDPLLNEPGFGARPGMRERYAADYNKTMRSLTVKYGLLHFAQNPPSLWKEIIENHFRKNGDKILQTAERWASDPIRQDRGAYDMPPMLLGMFPGRGTPEDTAALLPDLQVALRKYGATYVPQNMGSSSRQPPPSRGGPGYGGHGYAFGDRGGFGRPGGKSSFGSSPGSRYGRGW